MFTNFKSEIYMLVKSLIKPAYPAFVSSLGWASPQDVCLLLLAFALWPEASGPWSEKEKGIPKSRQM
jgi:hypothetical protein